MLSSFQNLQIENNTLKPLSKSGRSESFKLFFIWFPQIPILFDFSVSIRSILLVFGTGGAEGFEDSRRFRLIMWSIIAGTRGGPNRAKILNLLSSQSLNEHQISRELKLDHKTVHHHLEILIKNSLIAKCSEKSYDIKYDLTPIMKKNNEVLDEIMSKIRKR